MSVHWGGKGLVHVSRWSPLILGVPTLDLNFAASPILDSRVTFARSSAATVINSSGAMQSVAVDAPRFDYDPVTLQSRGLLIEESRSNVLLNSLLSGVSLLTQSVAVSAVVYTLSFYGTGTITLTGAHSATVTGTGAFPARRTLTFTPGVGALLLTVSGTVQFAQLEVGAFATSFIPTAGILASRSADVATMTGANFSGWYSQSEGTAIVSCSTFSPASAPTIYTISDGTGNNRIQSNADSGFHLFVASGGVAQASIDAGTFVADTTQRVAAAYKLNDFAAVIDGGTVGTDSAGIIPTANRLNIGSGATGGGQLNGHIRSIRYYNRRLANTQLRSLTSA